MTYPRSSADGLAVTLGTMRGDQGRGSSQWWPTTWPAASDARNSIGSVEVGHLHEGGAERVGHMAVAARTADDAELATRTRPPAD